MVGPVKRNRINLTSIAANRKSQLMKSVRLFSMFGLRVSSTGKSEAKYSEANVRLSAKKTKKDSFPFFRYTHHVIEYGGFNLSNLLPAKKKYHNCGNNHRMKLTPATIQRQLHARA